jgi:ketosteroid isomerase-like protein
MSPQQTVHEIYAAFGRGDLPAILARVADDVEWEYGAAATSVPWLEPRRGRTGVAAFFDALLSRCEMKRFEPGAVLAEGPLVVSLANVEFEVRATGRRVVEVDEVHLWHFDAAGLVRRFRHRCDTAHHAWALGLG